MKCSRCTRESITYVSYTGEYLCQVHFRDYFLQTFWRTFKRFNMRFGKRKFAIAVSGGKDSMVLYHIMKNSGYEIYPFFIRIGPPFVKLEEKLKEVIPEIDILTLSDQETDKIKNSERPCAICGKIKNNHMNIYAMEKDAVLMTGHNLDDAVVSLFMNFANMDKRISGYALPVSPPWPHLPAKAKPLSFLSSEEIKLFAEIENIPYFDFKCPYKKPDTTRDTWIKALNMVEKCHPAFKRKFYSSFVKRRKEFFRFKV